MQFLVYLVWLRYGILQTSISTSDESKRLSYSLRLLEGADDDDNGVAAGAGGVTVVVVTMVGSSL